MNKKSLVGVIYTLTFIGILLFVSNYIILDSEIHRINYLVIITFVVNGIYIVSNLLKKSQFGYSLDDILYIFMFIFMFLAPLIQYLVDIFPWWDTNLITDGSIIYCNLVIFLFILIYNITKIAYLNRLNKRSNDRYYIFNNIKFILNIGFILSVLSSLFIINNVGFMNLFTRSTNGINLDQSYALIVTNMFRAFPVILIAININYKKSYNKWNSGFQITVLCILTILICFPTGLPRYQSGAIYIGLLICFKEKFENKYMLKYIIIFGLIVLFPLLTMFRTNTLTDLNSLSINVPNPSKNFLEGDFDSYSMLIRTIQYVKLNTVTFGYQLLGVVLFFVPRTIWVSKPVGSGFKISNSLGWNFNNVSCPYIGEGYINFGIFGVIIFTIILALILCKFDFNYKKIIMLSDRNITIVKILYPFYIGFLFFILRGDLLSSFAYTIAFTVPVIILFLLDKIVSMIK